MMMQDSSMYGNCGSTKDILQDSAWLMELDNNSKQVVVGGLAQHQDIDSLPDDMTADILPSDLDDLPLDWMEEYVNLDSLLDLDVSLLDDATLHQMELDDSNSSDDPSTTKMKIQPDNDQSQIADTMQQLLQLQALVDPFTFISPPTSPLSSPMSPSSPNSSYSCPTSPEVEFTAPISPQNTFSPETIYSAVSSPNLFEPNLIVVSPVSPEGFVNVVIPTFSSYLSPKNDLYEFSPQSAPCSSPDLFCYSPETTASPQSVSDISDLSDSSAASLNQVFDSGATSSRKRSSDSLTVQQTKRSRKANPNQQPAEFIKVKKERKKDQNKTAATRYRMKKKSEADTLAQEESELKDKNKELTSTVDKLSTEIGYLKGLLKEILAVRGALKR